MGREFLFLSTTNASATRAVLSLTPHATSWGTCIYQEWVPNFDPDFPTGMKFPTWISLVKLPHEYKPFEGLIAASLSPIHAADPLNKNLRDPRFCIGLDVGFGWPSAIETKGLFGKSIVMLINYEDTPVRCRFCLPLNHKVGDCVALKLNPGVRGSHRDANDHQSHGDSKLEATNRWSCKKPPPISYSHLQQDATNKRSKFEQVAWATNKHTGSAPDTTRTHSSSGPCRIHSCQQE
jgi:hypothetical protein